LLKINAAILAFSLSAIGTGGEKKILMEQIKTVHLLVWQS